MVWERSLSYSTSIRELERCVVDAIAFYINYRYSPLFFFAPMKQSKGSLETLKSNWESLLQPFQLDPRVTQRVFLDLVTAYSSAARFYHTLEHIQHILEIINELRLLATNFPALQLAAWFHDAIYDSRANDNEEKSADYAVVALNQLEIPIVIIDRVKLLILMTKTHQALTTECLLSTQARCLFYSFMATWHPDKNSHSMRLTSSTLKITPFPPQEKLPM